MLGPSSYEVCFAAEDRERQDLSLAILAQFHPSIPPFNPNSIRKKPNFALTDTAKEDVKFLLKFLLLECFNKMRITSANGRDH